MSRFMMWRLWLGDLGFELRDALTYRAYELLERSTDRALWSYVVAELCCLAVGGVFGALLFTSVFELLTRLQHDSLALVPVFLLAPIFGFAWGWSGLRRVLRRRGYVLPLAYFEVAPVRGHLCLLVMALPALIFTLVPALSYSLTQAANTLPAREVVGASLEPLPPVGELDAPGLNGFNLFFPLSLWLLLISAFSGRLALLLTSLLFGIGSGFHLWYRDTKPL